MGYVIENSFKRWVNLDKPDDAKYELITFVDASKDAYAAVVYLKIIKENHSKINLIFSKNRLAPIKDNLTIPRLELMAVIIGCRAAIFVASQLKLHNLRQLLFTDSKCVMEWCRTNKALKRFVEDRVREIKESGIPIYHVKSEQNPADIASRGETAGSLKGNQLWGQYGPEGVIENLDELISKGFELDEYTRKVTEDEIRGPKIVHEM